MQIATFASGGALLRAHRAARPDGPWRASGHIDVHLLASTALAADARIWTRDGRLARVAAEQELAFEEEGEEMRLRR